MIKITDYEYLNLNISVIPNRFVGHLLVCVCVQETKQTQPHNIGIDI
jgi:hypothetical protein